MTLRYDQFLLLKLMEECAEVAQRASKQFQFGPDESQPGDNRTNAERLQEELYDLASIANMLGFETRVPEIYLIAKKAKLQKYRKYAEGIGTMKVLEP